jgi:hypothetical protein
LGGRCWERGLDLILFGLRMMTALGWVRDDYYYVMRCYVKYDCSRGANVDEFDNYSVLVFISSQIHGMSRLP